MPVGPDPATPLWRAAQVFRLLSCILCAGFPDRGQPGPGPAGIRLATVRRADRLERRLRGRLPCRGLAVAPPGCWPKSWWSLR